MSNKNKLYTELLFRGSANREGNIVSFGPSKDSYRLKTRKSSFQREAPYEGEPPTNRHLDPDSYDL